MKHRTSPNDILAAVVLTLYSAELVFPMMTTLLPSAAVRLICFLLWLLFAVTSNTRFLLWKNNFVLLLIYVYLSLYPAVCGYSTITNRYVSMSFVLCGSIVFRYYYAHNKLDILKKILRITALLSLITMLITYKQLLINPYISRSIKSSGEYSEMLARRGIGGYTFVYYIAVLSISVLYFGLKTGQKRKRVLAMIWYVFSILFVIKSNYMTAVLVVAVCSAILLVLSSASNKKWGFVLGLISGILVFVLVLLLDRILAVVGDFMPERIARVLISGSGGSAIESVIYEFYLDRWPTIQSSLHAFLKHPLLGLLGSGTLGYDGQFLTGLGQHSFVLDSFAFFGIMGGSICMYASFYPLKKSAVWKNHSPLRTAMMVCVMMMYFLNNATESIALAVAIISPYIACVVDADVTNHKGSVR